MPLFCPACRVAATAALAAADRDNLFREFVPDWPDETAQTGLIQRFKMRFNKFVSNKGGVDELRKALLRRNGAKGPFWHWLCYGNEGNVEIPSKQRNKLRAWGLDLNTWRLGYRIAATRHALNMENNDFLNKWNSNRRPFITWLMREPSVLDGDQLAKEWMTWENDTSPAPPRTILVDPSTPPQGAA